MTMTRQITTEQVEAAAAAVIQRLFGQDMPSQRDLAVIVCLDRAYGPGSRSEGGELR